jgi:GT2 family glycosyltransferase
MNAPKLSVIIPTHNRPDKLSETLAGLTRQDMLTADYEVIVVDDNSRPPVVLPESKDGVELRLVRLEASERSAARNAGASTARGEFLVFLDDDMSVAGDFIPHHLAAHREWRDAIVVGSIRLPDDGSPFVRFRQRLEDGSLPGGRGPTAMRNFCAAGNMSIPRDLFLRLGGFNTAISSGEDQDLALRHTARGGEIIFLPEARATHHDGALDIRSYSKRNEWGMENIIPFLLRHPDWPDNVERGRVNGPVRFGGEPFALSLRKIVKSALAHKPVTESLFKIASALERRSPGSSLLDRLYRLLLGIHIFRGYRRGLDRHGRQAQPGPVLRVASGVSDE